ncbi:MAG: LLM class flavin-dependent oxidoreductase [Defluviicoccus sp.]|nr:LLM class flavin-dependent oxidoreductase [Defluviicoccus sp.]
MTGALFRDIEIGLYSVSATADNRAVAKRAEARGFRRLWLAEDHHSRDIFVQATAIGTATGSIEIGLGIVNPYTRHPAQIAMAVADLEELAGPRFILGLGAGWSSISAHGLENPRPIAALREAAAICRGMLSGERFAFEGALYRLPAPGARLTFAPPRPDVPFYIGSMGPRTLKMAAPTADGVFFSVFASPAYVEHCLGYVREALDGTGRTVKDIDVTCYIVFSVDEDGDAARAAAKELIAHYLMRIPDTIRFEFAGLDVARMQSLQARLKSAFAENRLERAVAALDDDVVAALAVAGTPDECIEGLKPYAAAGLKTAVLYQVLGPDRLASVDLIADRIRQALAG